MTSKAQIEITAADSTRTAFSSVTRSLSGMQAAAAGVTATLAGIGGTLGIGVFTSMIKSSIDAADNLNDLKQQTGISVAALGGLQITADQSGTSLEGLAKGVRELSIFMVDAANGNKQNAATLKTLGVTAKEPLEALVQLANTFEKMPDGPTKTRLANDLLKKSGQELIPVLNNGGDALQKNLELYLKLNPNIEQLAQNADQFNDQMRLLKASATAAAGSIATDLLPAVNRLVTGFTTAKLAGASLFTWLTTGGDEEQNAGKRIDELTASIGRLKKQRDELSKPTLANKLNDVIFGDVQHLDAQIKTSEAKLTYLKNLKATEDALNASGSIKTNPDIPNTGAADAAKSAAEAAARLNSQAILAAQDRLQAAQKLSQVEQVTFDIEQGKYKGLTTATKTRLLEIASEIDAETTKQTIQKDQEALDKKTTDDGIARFKALEAAGSAVYASTRTDAQKYEAEVINLNDLLAQGAISQDTYNLAVLNAQDAYQKAADASKAAGDQMSQYAIQAARSSQTAFAQFLFDPFDDGLNGMAVGFLNTVRQMAANAASANIFESLFGGIGGGGGGGGGLLGGILGGVAKGFFGAFGFADGGDFGGGLRMVGENGPELEVTGPSRIFNANQTKQMLSGSGGSGDTINVNLHIQTGVQQTVRAEFISLIPEIRRQAVSAVANAKRRRSHQLE